jgi:NADPH-dependent 2,4-dienoyl-CoA reductase/sulfur reductase-like enzyme
MRLLVIGGTAAGMSAAARARRLDPSLEIVVLEKGPVVSFGACGLPYYIEGRIRNAEQMVVHTPEYFRKQRNISVRTNAGVVSIAHSRRQVSVEGGEHERYDRLVIATGARPRLTGIAGEALPHVFNLHRMSDGQRLRQFIEEKRPKTALIVGAGYIGFEAADAFRHRGMRVAIASLGFDALNRRDPELTKLISAHCERFGVEMRWNTTVQSVEDERADVVLIAAGIQPNVEIAREAGIETGRTGAIRVDDRLQTNLACVYAAGDCAETFHLVTGRHEWVPLGTTANKMGRVAGANAAGRRERFHGIVGTSVLRIMGLDIGLTGLSCEQARAAGFNPVEARIQAKSKPGYFGGRPITVQLVADRGTRRLLGGWVAGEHDVAGRANVIAMALQARTKVEEFEGSDLAYAPPFAPVWDPVLIAAQQLVKLLD